jgi:ribosomal protein S18 acetylase RimI-like enzyme
MIQVREAVEEDNSALLEMEAKCPMGTEFIINRESSPDFFDRVKPFEDGKLFVAEENGRIAGTAGCAIRETQIAGEKVRVCYEYGFLVDPAFRRRGIASMLHEQMEEYAETRDIDFLTLDVLEDNIPAMRLFEKKGFIHFKDLYNYMYPTSFEHPVIKPGAIRKATDSDLERIADLLNYTYSDFDHYLPFDALRLADYIERIPYFSVENIMVYEEDGEIKACLGYWDTWRVQRWRIVQIDEKRREEMIRRKLPYIPEPGDVNNTITMLFIGYSDESAFIDLLKNAINKARVDSVFVVNQMVDTECHLTEALSQVTHNPLLTIHCYAKPMKENTPKLGEKPYYFDQIDI